MITDYLAYRTASRNVQAFVDEGGELMARSQEALERLECESFLQLGIDAFHWLIRADEQYRKAVFADDVQYDPAFDASFDALCILWLKSSGFAESWVTAQERRGLTPANLAEFRECVRQAQSIIAENDEVSGEMAVLRDKALEAYEAGETDEWNP